MRTFAQKSPATSKNPPVKFVTQRLLQSNARDLNAGWTETELPHSGHNFSQISTISPSPVQIQPKLTISTPGDRSEQEADRVADQVMRRRAPELQRVCACGGGCPRCQSGQESTDYSLSLQQKKRLSRSLEPFTAPPAVNQALRSPGQPLDAKTRAFMEPRFGRDFAQVLVHTGAIAAEAASTVQANAFTVGDHVVFGAGQYNPASNDGRRLLAHELTHVVQQSGAMYTTPSDRAASSSAVSETAVAIARNPGGLVLQRDWALPTSGCTTPIQPLTQAQIQNAIQHSQGVLGAGSEIAYVRDVLGISRTIQIIDQDFVDALLRFQACFGLVQTGMLDHSTVNQLYQEILHEVVATNSSSQVADDTMISLLRYVIGVEGLRADMAAVARTEYANWQRGTALESDPAQLDELRTYWSSVSANPNPLATQSANDITPWSAAFISYVLTSAGPPDVQTLGFAPDASHITYIREALRNRECPGTQRCGRAAQVTGTRFHLYRPTEVAPAVGDLICKNRGNANFTYSGLQQSVCDHGQCPGGTTHCDIVEDVRPNQSVVTIGGNTANTLGVQTPGHTVGAHDLAIDQAGLLTNVNDLIGIIRVV
ncbi:hypothetical protein C7293_27385 [filamentous cyanobacterium CCT1]|nr:hypothetical protein C7293_27385 [filamentous cyanobacterium CCT1]